MIKLSFEYWNQLANQYILVSSLLSGFSIAIMATFLVAEINNRFSTYILKAATIAASCFLITVFAMTDIFLKTTPGYPFEVTESSFAFARYVGFFVFLLGFICLSVIISLSGWTKSRSTGIFTTVVGALTLIIILMTMVNVQF